MTDGPNGREYVLRSAQFGLSVVTNGSALAVSQSSEGASLVEFDARMDIELHE